MKKIITHILLVAQVLIFSTPYSLAKDEIINLDEKDQKALVELKQYCEDISANPLQYERNANDKSVLSLPVEVSPGKVKFDTLIKIDFPNAPSYVSCFQNFKTPFQEKSLKDKIAIEQEKIKNCKDTPDRKPTMPLTKNSQDVMKVTDKMMCEDAKKTSLPECANNLTYCGLENLHLASAVGMKKPAGLKCDSMLGQAGDVGSCMAIYIRGAFNEITDTLTLLVVDAPKWIYSKTLGKWFQEPAVKQLENVGSMEAVAATTATDKQIKDEAANPKKSLVEKITAFAQNLVLEKGVENFGCSEWSSGIPGVGKCIAPPASWECASCKEKAMTLCGVAGYATGMVVETAVLAAPVGVIAGSTLAVAVPVASVLGKSAMIAKAGKALKAGEAALAVKNAAKVVAKAGTTVGSAAMKVLAPIGVNGYKLGVAAVSTLKLIPGVELTAKVLSSPFKLWMKTDDLLTSKVWNLTYHGSKAYTQTLVKTGDVALATQSALVASKLNQAEKAGEAILKTHSELKLAEAEAGPKAAAKQKSLNIVLNAQKNKYDKLVRNISPKDIERAKSLESDHAIKISENYSKMQESLAAVGVVQAEKVAAKAAEKTEEVVATGKGAEGAAPEVKLTARQVSAEEFAKILAVDEETQKLLSDPVIAQYVYLNYFATVKDQAELKVALQDIVNSTQAGNADIFKLVNEKIAGRIKDPEVQAKVKAAFDGKDQKLRPSAFSTKTYELKSRVQQVASMPTTISRLKKITDEGFSLEVLDQGLFDFYGATQLGLKDSQLRGWTNVKGGFSAVRPDQVENISPELWSNIAHFASETEAPIHGYSTNSGDALRGLIPSVSRFMGKNEHEYQAFMAKAEQDIAKGERPELFCTNVWCTEEKRHETAVQRIGEQVTGVAKTEPKTYEAAKAGDYLDPEYGLKHLVGRNSSEWNANSVYLYMRSHAKPGSPADILVDNVRKDETKHMAIFSSAFKYFYGDQPGVRTKGMIEKIAQLKKEAAVGNSSGNVLSSSTPTLIEVGVTHLFVENKVREFMKSVPLKTMEKIFDSPVKTLRDLESVPLTAEQTKAILEMNERELKNRANLARWTPKQRELYTALKEVEVSQGPLIESLVQNLFKEFKGAEVPNSPEAKAVLEQIKKLRTGLDSKTNALIQMSLTETLRDYQIMNNKYVRSQPDLKVIFKSARDGFVVEHKGQGVATVIAAKPLTDTTFTLSLQKPKDVEFKPGQAVRVEIDTPQGKDFRVLSLASSPSKDHVEFAVGVSDSDFKKALMKLKPNQSVTLSKAKGAMDFDFEKPVIMIAGGIGITPFRSAIQYARDNKLNTPMHLWYSNKKQIPFGQEFTDLANTMPEFNYQSLLSQPDASWTGKTGRIDEPYLAQEVPKLPKDSKYYIVGPPAMVTGTQANLVKLGVDPKDIQIEIFAFEKPEGAAARATADTGTAEKAAPAEKAVCKCYGVGKTDIIKVIKKGATTIDEIGEATGATRGCGGCACAVEDILTCEMKSLGK